MSLGRLLYLAEPQFPQLENGDGENNLDGLWSGLKNMMCVKVPSKYSLWILVKIAGKLEQ